ncbi:MAG: hypothetical protein AB7G80_09700 [Dongiaceae bacterium]
MVIMRRYGMILLLLSFSWAGIVMPAQALSLKADASVASESVAMPCHQADKAPAPSKTSKPASSHDCCLGSACCPASLTADVGLLPEASLSRQNIAVLISPIHSFNPAPQFKPPKSNS